jgi:hypothetical protein
MNPAPAVRLWACGSLILSTLLLAGCCCPGKGDSCHGRGGFCSRLLGTQCADVPQGAIPEPPGAFVRRFQFVQEFKAEADDFVIYLHEWYRGGKELGPWGKWHLEKIIRRLPEVDFPVLIQIHPDPALNQERWDFVVRQVALAGIPDAEQRVILGNPRAEGLYGDEAERIYQALVTGADVGGFGAAFAGFGGGFGVPGFGGGFVPGFGFGGFGGFGF